MVNRRNRWQTAWLDRNITDTDVLMSVLQPYSEDMYAFRLPDLVGNVRNDGPECVKATMANEIYFH
jgi:putative SOS response-associated peptidase YedK